MLRRQLEAFHGQPDESVVAFARPHLSSSDPWIRHAALLALAAAPLDSWFERPSEVDDLTALLIPANLGADCSPEVRKLTFSNLQRYEKLTALRIIGLAGAQNTGPNRAFLAPCFPDGDPAIDRELSLLLARFGDVSVVAKSIAKLAATDSQADRLHYLNVLSQAEHGWTNDARTAFFVALQHPDYFRGDSNLPGYLKGIRERAIATLSDDERAALGDLIKPAQSDLPLPAPRPLVRHWATADLLATPPPQYRHDPARGRAIFAQALCSRCHQFGAVGTPLQPNLSAVASRFSRRDLIEAIVEPSKSMAEIFRPLIIKKRDVPSWPGRWCATTSGNQRSPSPRTRSRPQCLRWFRRVTSPVLSPLQCRRCLQACWTGSLEKKFQLLDLLEGAQR